MGAAYGTAKSGVGVASMGIMRPELVMKSIVPVVMAGVLGIYGLIIAVIIGQGIDPDTYTGKPSWMILKPQLSLISSKPPRCVANVQTLPDMHTLRLGWRAACLD